MTSGTSETIVKAYRVEDGSIGQEVIPGEVITDFKGDKWFFAGITSDGRNSWKVMASKPHNTMVRIMFPSVFNLILRTVEK